MVASSLIAVIDVLFFRVPFEAPLLHPGRVCDLHAMARSFPESGGVSQVCPEHRRKAAKTGVQPGEPKPTSACVRRTSPLAAPGAPYGYNY